MLHAFSRAGSYQYVSLLAGDFLFTIGSAACIWTLLSGRYPGSGASLIFEVTLFSVTLLAAFYYRDLYEMPVYSSPRCIFMRWTQCMGVCGVVILVTEGLLSEKQFGIQRGTLTALIAGSVVLSWRLIFGRIVRNGQFAQRILIVGTGQAARKVAEIVLSHGAPGFQVAGFIGPKEAVGTRLLNPCVIGSYETLEDVLSKEPISAVVVAQEDRRKVLPMDVLLNYRISGGRILEDTQFLEAAAGRVPLPSVKPAWFVFSDGFNRSCIYFATKQMLEFIVSAIILLVHLPFIAVLALLIKLESPGSVFYRQKRVGKDGKVFWLYKLRSMKEEAEAHTGPVWAEVGDTRITRVGRIVRCLRLDELPQLLNVLRGDMSLVGPRPERPEFVEQLRRVIPHYDRRHSVKPGITGWAQTSYPYGGSIEDAKTKFEYDLYYIKHMSIVLDIFIIAKTVKTVLCPSNGR